MTCYFVAQIDIRDPEGYARYLDGFDEIFDRYRGTVLAVDDAAAVLEGEWPWNRTVLIEFPDREELDRWYRSPEYQRLAGRRRAAAAANIAAVEGRA